MLFLSPSEVTELTGKVRRPAQLKALRTMGIEHKVRPDGKVIIARSHIEKVFDGNNNAKVERRIEPNWDVA
jgi:hypothetical protein